MLTHARGFALLPLLVVVLACGAVVGTGWYVYATTRSSQEASVPAPASTPEPAVPAVTKVQTATSNSRCTSKLIIVMFKESTSKDRQRAIIDEQKLTIRDAYQNFSGYSLVTPDGQQQHYVDVMRKYPEVSTANLDSCDSTNSTTTADSAY